MNSYQGWFGLSGKAYGLPSPQALRSQPRSPAHFCYFNTPDKISSLFGFYFFRLSCFSITTGPDRHAGSDQRAQTAIALIKTVFEYRCTSSLLFQLPSDSRFLLRRQTESQFQIAQSFMPEIQMQRPGPNRIPRKNSHTRHRRNRIGQTGLKAAEQTTAGIGRDPAMRQQNPNPAPAWRQLQHPDAQQPKRRIPLDPPPVRQPAGIPDHATKIH